MTALQLLAVAALLALTAFLAAASPGGIAAWIPGLAAIGLTYRWIQPAEPKEPK